MRQQKRKEGKKILEKAKNVIEIKVCVDGMDELKKFIKKMEQEYGSTHTLVYKVDVFDAKHL
jgi:cellulose synthase/poly-beta-1,6-N-acetylglucosamine synthase-like glycosyltransferase